MYAKKDCGCVGDRGCFPFLKNTKSKRICMSRWISEIHLYSQLTTEGG